MDDKEQRSSIPPATRRRPGLLPGVGVALVLAVGASLVAFTPQRENPGPEIEVENVLPDDSLDEMLALPPIDLETMEWLDRMQTAIARDPDFGTVAISTDRLTVTITWFEEPSETLHAFIDQAPSPVSVVIQPAAFRPLELRELATRAISSPELVPGVRVAMSQMENDGSGVRVGIVELPRGRSLEDIGAELASALGRADVPVTVEVSGAIVPISG